MGPMGNGGTGGMRYRGMSNRVQGYGPISNGVQGVWGTRGVGHMGNGSHGQWDTGGIGHMGNRGTGGMGYKGYGPHRQWDTWAMGGQWDTGVWAMGPMGDLLPKYQKYVKLSKRCQVVKKMSNVKK